MVMNHTCCTPDWPPAGIFISYSEDLSQPEAWKQPKLLLEGGGWYPMVMGLGRVETDKLAGRSTRFFYGVGQRLDD